MSRHRIRLASGPFQVVIGAMLNAVAIHWRNGLWAADNGVEYPLVMAARSEAGPAWEPEPKPEKLPERPSLRGR